MSKTLNRRETKKLLIFGILSVLVSFISWGMDLFHVVEPCIYCRTERTLIGIVGFLMIIPTYSHLRLYLAFTLGLYGALVAGDQISMYLMDDKYHSMIYLAIGAFFILTSQMYVIIYYLLLRSRERNTRY